MIKPNSKQAKEKINNYLLTCVTNWAEENDKPQPKDNNEAKEIILNELLRKLKHLEYSEAESLKRFYKNNFFNVLVDYSQGLSNMILSYNWELCNAVDFVGNLLEETEEQKSSYNEELSKQLLYNMLYDSIMQNKRVYELLNR